MESHTSYISIYMEMSIISYVETYKVTTYGGTHAEYSKYTTLDLPAIKS
jgi:hypothetical protein